MYTQIALIIFVCHSIGSSPKFWEIHSLTFECIWPGSDKCFAALNYQWVAYAFWVRWWDRYVAFDWFSIDSRKMFAHVEVIIADLFPHFSLHDNFSVNTPNHQDFCLDVAQARHSFDVPFLALILNHHTLYDVTVELTHTPAMGRGGIDN